MKILITGAAGYIGGMLINKLIKDGEIEKIIAIDLLDKPERIKADNKLFWIKTDLTENSWQEIASKNGPIDVIVDAAFKIRNPFGKIKDTEKNNLGCLWNALRFAEENSVPKMIYLGSVASYAARKENIGKIIDEDHELLEAVYAYGVQKRKAEEIILEFSQKHSLKSGIIVLRLNSVTGPLGQSLKSKFGLITFIKKILPVIVATNDYWGRQYVHEDDVTNAIIALADSHYHPQSRVEIFNLAPEGFLTAKGMGKILNKKVVKFPASLARAAFAIAWPLTLGKVPTPPGSVNGLIYPIHVSGKKIELVVPGFRYQFSPEEAFLGERGLYSEE